MVAVKRGEFDDLETPARRILLDDEPLVHRDTAPTSSAISPGRPDSR
jgi:nitrogen fixation-related uncharacterized protein